MTNHDDRMRLRHMLDHANEAIKIANGRTRSDLDDDRMLELSLVRLLEIIGDAASRVGPEIRSKHPSIPWIHIAGMRNRLIHGYDEIDLDVLWDTIQDDLPLLVEKLTRIISEE